MDGNWEFGVGGLLGIVIGGLTMRSITRWSGRRQIQQRETEFISLTSHQLRTPLSTIRWYGELLLAGDAGQLEPEQREFIKNIMTANRQMISLVDAMLTVALTESGQMRLRRQAVNLNQLITGCLEHILAGRNDRHVTVELQADRAMPAVWSDGRLLELAVEHLIRNAVVYTPDGGRVNITAGVRDGWLTVVVMDTGCGVPERARGRIFRKFYRADNARQMEVQGAGLGLYIVRLIAKLLGGWVDYQSRETLGSVFRLVVPVQSTEVNVAPQTI